jgi:hypothetical protein
MHVFCDRHSGQVTVGQDLPTPPPASEIGWEQQHTFLVSQACLRCRAVSGHEYWPDSQEKTAGRCFRPAAL